jgi:nicotinate-nucleotide adenylyltransferase
MNIAIFGGTFDPIHRGHLAVARAAQERFDLRQVYFVPADVPPHKQRRPVTAFHHRYAMVALGTSGQASFLPSLLEAPRPGALRAPSYSLETVRRFRTMLAQWDRLYFLIGIDAFMEIGSWYKAEELLQEVEFIVVSRPGFSLADLADALPESLRPAAAIRHPFQDVPANGDLVLGGVVLHLLPEVREKVSATQLRSAAAKGRSLGKLVPEAVAEYIRKMRLYRQAVEVPAAVSARQQTKVVSIRHGKRKRSS